MSGIRTASVATAISVQELEGSAGVDRTPVSPKPRAWPQIGYWLVLVSLLGGGVALRVLGAAATPLWMDEAKQAVLVSGPIDYAAYATHPGHLRPGLYLLLHQLVARIHNVEWTLRGVSVLASIAGLLLGCWIARRCLKSALAVFFVTFVLAFHPSLIEFAKEFKPGALEHFLVLALLALGLRWKTQPTRRSLSGLLVLVTISPLLGFATVFFLPFFLVWLTARGEMGRPEGGDQRHVNLLWGVGVLGAALFAAQYLAFQRHATQDSFSYWRSNFYDHGVRPSQLAKHLLEVFGIGRGRVLWPGIRGIGDDVVQVATVLLCLGGGVVAARRGGWRWSMLLVGPLLLPALVSLTGRWPYGAVRTNLYMIGLGAILVGLAVDALRERRRWWLAAPMVALMLLQLPVRPGELAAKSSSQDVPAVLSQIADRRPLDQRAHADDTVEMIGSAGAAAAGVYYTRFHAELAGRLGGRLHWQGFLPYRAEQIAAQARQLLVRDHGRWLVLAHVVGPAQKQAYQKLLADPTLEVMDRVTAKGADAYLIRLR